MLPTTLALSLASPIPIPSQSRTSDLGSEFAAIGDAASASVAIALLVAFVLGWSARTRPSSASSLGRAINTSIAVGVVLAAIAAALASLNGATSILSLAVFAIVVTAAAALARPFDARGDPLHRDRSDADRSAEEIAAAGATMLSDHERVLTCWTSATNTYVAEALMPRLRVLTDDDGNVRDDLYIPNCWPRLSRFIPPRLSEGLGWMAPDAAQITVWTANGQTGTLHFAFSTQNVGAAVTEATFGPGEGIAGAAFSDSMNRNEIHPSELTIFKAFPGIPYPFESMLAVPIKFGARVIGVLCVDRMRAERFDTTTIVVMEALARSLGTAIGLEQWIENFRKR